MAEVTSTVPKITEQRVEFVQVVNEPRPSVAELTPFALANEPDTDRGFVTPSGVRLRVRMMPIETPETLDVPGASVTSTAMAFRVTISTLTASNAVAKDSTGALLISPPHELYLQPGQMVDGFDVAAFVDQELRKAAYEAEVRVAQQKSVVNFFKDKWPGALPKPA